MSNDLVTSLLVTKLLIPPPRSTLIHRPHLVERINDWVQTGYRLILVSAPAGFGKTTLLSSWANSQQGRSIAWLSLDKDDNDPARFWIYLIAALQTVEDGIGGAALEMLRSTRPRPIKAVITVLINELSQTTGELVIVLDDYHLIEELAVHNSISFLIENLPPHVHLVIASRSDPPLQLSLLRGRGQLGELRMSQLRFTQDETAEFLTKAVGLKLAAGDISALATRTEGWIAGLTMAAVSLEGQRDPAGFVRDFTGSDQHVLDYLMEEVLHRQPEGLQSFLLQTAILDRLTGPLCDAVTQREDSQAILEGMARANVFTVPLDNERRWYRYHQLFADLLLKRLDEAQPALAVELHRRAGAWFQKQGHLGAAIEHTLRAGEAERAADIVEQAAEGTFMRSEVVTLLTWIDALPEDLVRTRPRLCAYKAGAVFMAGRPLDEAESLLQLAAGYGLETAPSEATVFEALIATIKGDMDRSGDLSHQALDTLPEDSVVLRSLAAENLAIVHTLRGDTKAAIQAFEETVSFSRQTDNTIVTVGALCNLAGLVMTGGGLHRAEELYRQALELAEDRQGHRLPVAGKALIGLAEIHREWNNTQVATSYATEGIELLKGYGEIGNLLGYITLARVKRAAGDLNGAQELTQMAQEIAARFDATQIDDTLIAAYQIYLWLLQGEVDAAARCIQEHQFESLAASYRTAAEKGRSAIFLLQDAVESTLARVYSAQGRHDEAIEILGFLLQEAERQAQVKNLIKDSTLMALALYAQGEVEQALTSIGLALSLGEPEGYVRTLVDEGEPMARLLYEAASRGIAPEYTGKLLAILNAEIGTLEQADSPEQELVEPLSDREIEVLELIAEGLTNREIANLLSITLSTVKGHTSNIYGKLGVNNRTQAVATSKRLGILP
jgi:LuxR family maltose regulon positive regulatory protein